MANNKTDILVYAHWLGMPEPQLMGILSAHQAKGKKAFSFEPKFCSRKSIEFIQ